MKTTENIVNTENVNDTSSSFVESRGVEKYTYSAGILKGNWNKTMNNEPGGI